MARASRPDYGVTIALAGVVARSREVYGVGSLPLFGLTPAVVLDILDAHFPGAGGALARPAAGWTVPEAFAHAIELGDLVDMLVEHRTVEDDDSRWLAHAIATACLGGNHLWQDMNLPARSVLSDLFQGFFTSLAVRNRQDMKWKKFLYKQLCERAEIRVCKSPNCEVCVDYALCFGPED